MSQHRQPSIEVAGAVNHGQVASPDDMEGDMHDLRHGNAIKRVFMAKRAMFLATFVPGGWVVTRVDGKRIFSEFVESGELEGWMRRYNAQELSEETWNLLPGVLTA